LVVMVTCICRFHFGGIDTRIMKDATMFYRSEQFSNVFISELFSKLS